jgi:hypothetical protein
MKREMDKVRQGQDPMAIIRDPAQNQMIDTKLMETIAHMSRSRAPEARAVA